MYLAHACVESVYCCGARPSKNGRGAQLENAIAKVGDGRGINHPCALQFQRLCAQMLEQADTIAQEDGDQVNLYFIQ